MDTLINWEIIVLNHHSLPVMFVGLLLIGAGFSVLVREHGSSLGIWYWAFSASVGLYCLGAGISYAVQISALALQWERAAHVGVSLIPGTYFIVTTLIIGKREQYQRLSLVIMAVSVCFAVAAAFSDLMVASNVILYWGFYPRYGIIGLLNIIYFIIVMLACYILYIREYRKSHVELHRKRLRGMMIALAVGYIGAVDFLPALGVPVYAFGYIPIFLFVALIGVVIIRYQLIDITPEIAASQILKTMQSALFVVDLAGIIRIANAIACRLLAPDHGQILELPLVRFLQIPPDQARCKNLEIVIHEHSQNPITLNISSSELKDRRGLHLGTVYVAHDISASKIAEHKLRELALHDPLTALPNRVLLFDRIQQHITRANRNGTRVAILYMDLDRFKIVNDQYGHAVGDEVLLEAAKRLKLCLRGSDTVARVGGDEFVGLCTDLHSPSGAEVVAAKILESLSQPFHVSPLTIHTGVSIGISIYPVDTDKVDTLLSLADSAMYSVKQSGRGGILRWTPESSV